MFTPETRENDFFDQYVYQRRVKNDHELMKIKTIIDWSFVETVTRELYSQSRGRPGYPPGILFRMLFLEYYANLSDRDVTEQCELNLLYQKFVGIGMDEDVPESTSLVEFRNRLGEQKVKELFDELIRQCKEKKLLVGKVKAIDATHLVADVALSNTMNLLRQGRRKILARIGKKNKAWYEELIKKYPSDKIKKRGKASNKEVAEEIEQTKQFIQEATKNADQQMREDIKELEKLTRGETGLVSFHDKDARWGHKKKEEVFGGYKVNTSMDESQIVTSVGVVGGNTNEAELVEEIIKDDLSKGVTAECLALDGLYDRADVYELGDRYEMEVYAPCRHGVKGLEKEYFFFDEKGSMRCRNYSIAGVEILSEQQKRYRFYASDCQMCLSKGGCLKRGKLYRELKLNTCRERSMKQDKFKKEEALNKRKRIEAKYGEAKKWHRLGRARYRGRWKVGIQALLTFFVTNAKRMVKLIQKQCDPPPVVGLNPSNAV